VSWIRRHPWRSLVLGVLGVSLLTFVVLVFTPLFDRTITSTPDPAMTYSEASTAASELAASGGDEINDLCRSVVVDSGERVERSVILLHGFTNCPQQYSALARAYADAGYNVVIPRLPGHGEVDRLTTTPSDVGPDDLVDAADEAVDIAAGLGRSVTVVGLSGGGTLASWLAYQRDEVTEAIIVAPLVAPKSVPDALTTPIARLSRYTPDIYLWWDDELKEELASPPYAYPRFSLRSLGSFLAVARAAEVQDSQRTTQLQRLVVVTNENDAAVSNAGVHDIERQLEHVLSVGHDADVEVDYVFPAEDGYRHDLIDPEGENADALAEIYAELGPLMGLDSLESYAP